MTRNGPVSGRQVAENVGPVGYALAHAGRAHRAELQQSLTLLGLHLGQELIVVDLHEHPDSTQGELVERVGVEQPTIAKALSRMQRSGFVEQTRDETDRRITRLRLTPQGEAVVEAVVAAWRDADARITKRLSAARRRQLLDLLHEMAAANVEEHG